ncbi:major facilitator superfamily domain-containing protein [Ditylenchus destructor]|nr:major facilitator superfamily domain-containing protein [Ditylenchus destructor]
MPPSDIIAVSPPGFWSVHSVRLQMAILLSLAMTVHGIMRANLGMALVCMVRVYAKSEPKALLDNTTQPTRSLNSSSDYNTAIQVDWNASSISVMHAAFYVGMFASVIVSHRACQIVGAKRMISLGLLVNVLCTWALPVVVYFAPHYLFTSFIRFLTGFAQGFFIPCASLLIAKWFAESEKSTAMAIFTTGNQAGISVAMFATAELCKLPVLGGWPTSFFASGCVGAIFMIFWITIGSERPRNSKRITAVELAHIDGVGIKRRTLSVVTRTPYKKILLSPVIFSMNLCAFCQSFVLVSMISYLPEFNRAVLGLNLSANGKWSALPFLIQVLSKIFFAFAADSMKQRGVSVNFVTKLFNSIASFGCAMCMLVVSLTSNGMIMLVFLCLGLSLTSGYVAGYNTSIVCVAPAYTAAVSAYGQGFSQIASILAPMVIGFVTKQGSVAAWSLVFQILVVILFVSGVCFQFFGSANVQPWASLGLSPLASKRDTSKGARSEEKSLIPGVKNGTNGLEGDQEVRSSKMLLVEEEVETGSRNGSRRPTRVQRVSIMDENGDVYLAGEEQKLKEPF